MTGRKAILIALSILLVLSIYFSVKLIKSEETAITISAASSLKDAMEEIKKNYEKENPKIALVYNFGASGFLQSQIEQGAEVDLYISAAAKHMDALQAKDLVLEETRKNLLGNRLVLVVPKDSSTMPDIESLKDEGLRLIALGESKSVPAGQYTEEVLKKFDILDSIKHKVVFGKNVKEVLTWVETANADAGFIYETDAKASNKVKISAIAPMDSHKPIIYPSAVLRRSKNADAANEFINYLYSYKAKVVFEKFGFLFIAE